LTTKPHDRVALVTGAGSGIGRATANLLVREGWRVVFAGRRPEALRESIAMCEDPFDDIARRAFAVPCDVTRPDSVAALFDFVRARCGRLDLLFNNAGVFTPEVPIEQLTVEQWRAALDVNVTGAFLCTREAFRLMKTQQPRGGRIVNNGGLAAQVPRPDAVATTASKHALTGLTRACALDGRAFRIAVGQIDIGNAATETTATVDDGEARIEVDDAAAAVLHMANLPLEANVLFMTVLATGMPFVGRG
jgi:NAD(P)-dependent dehydrogenase (short-subunit alcohol dehydrogenase family)